MSLVALDPEIIWGLFVRSVGVIYVIAFGALLPQHHIMPGSHRLGRISELRKRVKVDFPGPRRFLEMPSLLWLNDSDPMQRGMTLVGFCAGAMAIYGGPLSFYALLIAWMCWLSLEPRGLMFPWDTMLQEAGFLVLFVPMPEALPSLHASALPLPSVAFMARWLVLRLMFGFGKDKFLQTKKDDFLFLRGFFVWMPLPSPLGWYAHHLPAWMLRLSLLFMFVAEVLAPIAGLFSGPIRLASAAVMASLMLGIQVTGNWGFFNVGFILLCICLFDTQSSLFDLGNEPWHSRLSSWPDIGVHTVMALMFLTSLFYLFNNSWVTRSWVHWTPEMFALPPKVRAKFNNIHRLLAPLRAIAPFRIVNGYGVFPPHSGPAMRLTPTFEGSMDGVEWKQYGYRFMPSFAHSRPPFVAPWQPRFDQFTYYVTMSMDSGSLFGSLFPMSNPYTIGTRVGLFDLIVQRLLADDPKVLCHFGHNPFPDRPPRWIRVGLIAMTATRPAELRATGQWWHVRRVGTFIPARGIESWPERVLIPHPELFHPDLLHWKRRALPLQKLSAAHASGLDPDQAVLVESDLTPDDVDRFWNELVPRLSDPWADWEHFHERAAQLSAQFGAEGLLRLERVLERYVWLLRDVSTPLRDDEQSGKLASISNYRFQMILHELVCAGRETYRACLAEPSRVAAHTEQSTDATQLWTLGMFRYDQLMAHVRVFRSSEMGLRNVKDGLPSFFEYYPFLVAIVPPDETFKPEFVKHPDGEHTIAGFYPPPPLLAGTTPARE
jgi:hypothetical protein